MVLESIAATDFWPLLVTLIYGAFGFAHAKTKGENWDGNRFFRLVAIGIGVNVGGLAFGLGGTEAETAILPFATVLVDQLVKIVLQWRKPKVKAPA